MTVMVRVDLHRAQITDFLYNPTGAVVRGVRRWSQEVRSTATARAPKQTGRLASDSSVEMNTFPGFIVGVITFNAPYALFVHEGTGIYGPRGRPIRARGKMMKFRAGSGRLSASQARRLGGQPFTYASSVRGQHPKPFLVWALRWVMLPKGARIRTFRVR